MTDEQIAKIVQLSQEGVLQQHIAERFGLSKSRVSHIICAWRKVRA